MTLNITIVSPAGIHQSADFQISKTERASVAQTSVEVFGSSLGLRSSTRGEAPWLSFVVFRKKGRRPQRRRSALPPELR
jgi:hypothetical protein